MPDKKLDHAPEGFRPEIEISDNSFAPPAMMAATVDHATDSMKVVQVLKAETATIGLSKVDEDGTPFINVMLTFGSGGLFLPLMPDDARSFIGAIEQAIKDAEDTDDSKWHSVKAIQESIDAAEEETEDA